MRESHPKHRRIARERARLKRQDARRKAAETVLVVCEGAETEPNYLKGLREHFRINPARVEIVPGTTQANAVAVVERAIDRLKREHFDRAFVVVDAEQKDFDRAVALAKKRRANEPVQIICSKPCFEFWLLLHFCFCDRPFTACDQVITELQSSLPRYAKNDRDIFIKVGGAGGLMRAVQHAKRLRNQSAAAAASDPWTDMDQLVEAFMRLLAAAKGPFADSSGDAPAE